MIQKMKNIQLILIVALVSPLMTFDVNQCTYPIEPILKSFTYTINGTQDDTTKAHICHDQYFLYVYWWSLDTQIISTHDKCNDPLYNEDAVEIFIATDETYPTKYFELQVSPKGQLFFADITNPTGYCSNLGTKYYNCDTVSYTGTIKEKGWDATLKISKNIVGRGQKLSKIKANLFRIDKSTSKPTRYLSYQPTLNSPACFHQPKAFIDFYLI